MINSEIKDGDPPVNSKGVLHLPVGKVLLRLKPVAQQPDRFAIPSTVIKKVGTLTNLQQGEINNVFCKIIISDLNNSYSNVGSCRISWTLYNMAGVPRVPVGITSTPSSCRFRYFHSVCRVYCNQITYNLYYNIIYSVMAHGKSKALERSKLVPLHLAVQRYFGSDSGVH